MNSVFQNLDKNRIPHGILLDFGMDFTNVPAYNGTLTDSTNMNVSALKQIYNTLLMSRIRNVSTGFVTPEQFGQNWQNNRSKDFIALSGLYFKYSRFTSNAYPNKINYSNEMFSDKYVAGVWQNPYQVLKTFAITSPIQNYMGLNLKVKLPQAIFYSNVSSEIQSIAIDFGDGLGYRAINYNQLVNVSYSQAGIKEWKYKLSLTNGQKLYSRSKINIEEGLNAKPFYNNTASNGQVQPMSVQQWNCDGSGIYALDVEAELEYLGQKGQARITLDDAGNDCQITNP